MCIVMQTENVPQLSLKLKETEELNLKKKKCTFPKAMLLSYNNDILQSRNRDKSGKYHDIILVMVLLVYRHWQFMQHISV